MSNKEKLLWSIWAGILVLLYLMSSTDLIIKEKEIQVYPISVIIEGDNDDYYVNFKKGMDQAAQEFHADISFITLYGPDDQEQQLELVKREVKDGTRAIILAPVKPGEAAPDLERLSPGCPVVLLEEPPSGSALSGSVCVDGREAGRMLAKEAAAHIPGEVPVCLLSRGLEYGNNLEVYQGAREVLEEKGRAFGLIEEKDREAGRLAMEEIARNGSGRIAVMALDVQSLNQAAGMLEDGELKAGVAGLYGVGSTTSLLRALDRGVITGMTAYNQFDQGYLSVKQAVEAIQDKGKLKHTRLEAVYVDRTRLRDKAYEKMFYPIE